MTVEIVLLFGSSACAIGLALAVAFREAENSAPRNAYVLGMVVFGLESALAGLGRFYPMQSAVLLQWRLAAMALLPGCWLLFSLTYARGGDRAFIRRWRWIAAAFFIIPAGIACAAWPTLITDDPQTAPDDVFFLPLGRPGVILHALFMTGIVLSLMNLEKTLRASKGTMRWRIKYAIVGLGIIFSVRYYSAIQAMLFSAVNLKLDNLNALALILGGAMASISLMRGPLLSVDLYPSHGILSGSLTLAVAGTYLIIVGLLAEAAKYFGVTTEFPLNSFLILLAIVGAAAILLSDRLRLRTKRFVSGHFRRPQYDYRMVWSKLAERTAPLTTLGEFCRAVCMVVSEIFDLLAVTIWQVDELSGRISLGGSSSLTGAEAARRIRTVRADSALLAGFRGPAYPVLIGDTDGDLGDLLRNLGQKEFGHGGESFYIPLASGNEVLGILVCADRVNGLPLTEEERQLFETIGRQISANLLAIRLSDRLVEAQKLEAFQSMSAFFVHDLKNTASTLALMLQNLPRHFDDPDFRRDALKGISTSVDKINGLIRKLSLFRRNIELKPASADLNAIVKSTLEKESVGCPETIRTDLSPLPPVCMDTEQINKVIVNLVLNARESSPDGNPVEIRTYRKADWVVLSVSDKGCGMTPEFMEQSLFKPFQSTKQNGIGIGMFHCKMIVEAHHGRIEVESRKGEGSTFRVLLPLKGRTT